MRPAAATNRRRSAHPRTSRRHRPTDPPPPARPIRASARGPASAARVDESPPQRGGRLRAGVRPQGPPRGHPQGGPVPALQRHLHGWSLGPRQRQGLPRPGRDAAPPRRAGHRRGSARGPPPSAARRPAPARDPGQRRAPARWPARVRSRSCGDRPDASASNSTPLLAARVEQRCPPRQRPAHRLEVDGAGPLHGEGGDVPVTDRLATGVASAIGRRGAPTT